MKSQNQKNYRFVYHPKIKVAAAALIGVLVIGMAPRSSKSSKKPLSGTIFEDTYVATLEDGEKHIVSIELSNESGCVYYDVLTDEHFLDITSTSISVNDPSITVHDVKNCVPLDSLLTSKERKDSMETGLSGEQLKTMVDRVTAPDVKTDEKARVRK